jgi:hypothetical protein
LFVRLDHQQTKEMAHGAPAPVVYYSLSRQRKRFFTRHRFFRLISQLVQKKAAVNDD